MILANLSDLIHQIVLTPNMEKAVRFLRETDLNSLPTGRSEIDGNMVFAMVNSYSTIVPGTKLELEGHKKYIDVQFMLSGEELIGWSSAEKVPVTKVYNEEKDFWCGELPKADLTWLRLTAGQAAVFYPNDAHAPQMAKCEPGAVKKIVVKVAL